MENNIKNNGWIALHRQILDNPITSKPSYLSVWIHLLLMANHKETSFIWNNQKQVVKEGQLLTGLKVLSKKTGVAQGTVYRILKYLENEKQIEQQKTTKFTIITIVNWDKYQRNEKRNEKQIKNRLKTNEKQMKTYNNNNNVNKNNNIHITNNLKEIVQMYNQIFGKSISSTKGFEKNYEYWREVHDMKKIQKALENASKDKFWKDKMTLTILFRRKNTNGEPVDYIEDLSNREPSSGGDVAII